RRFSAALFFSLCFPAGKPRGWRADGSEHKMYDRIRAIILADRETRLSPVPADVIERVRKTYPGIPRDYLAFLEHVCWGAIAMAYVIYESPRLPSESYGTNVTSVVKDLTFFGDDMAGRCAGFNTNGWNVVEVLPGGQSALSRWKSFYDFVEDVVSRVL